MKKSLLSATLVILLSTVIFSCKKTSPALSNCDELLSTVNAAQIKYSISATTANCQAYKAALNNMLNCPVISAQEKTAYRDLFSLLTC